MGIWIIKIIRYIIDSIEQLIYPFDEKCLICNEESEEFLCNKCKNEIKFINENYEIKKEGYKFRVLCCAYYGLIIKELVLRFKYKNDYVCGEALSQFIIEKAKEIKFDYISFVPSSEISIKQRGYNQSRILAKYLSSSSNKPLIELLKKDKKTKDQIGLGSLGRWSNLENSYRYIKNKQVENKIILLVDDVYTTGATAFYCAKEIKKLGVKDIIILTVAKSRV